MSSVGSSSRTPGGTPEIGLHGNSKRYLQSISNEAFSRLSDVIRGGVAEGLKDRVRDILIDRRLPHAHAERAATELVGLGPADAAKCLDDLQFERDLRVWEREGEPWESDERAEVAAEFRRVRQKNLSEMYLHDLGTQTLPPCLKRLTSLRRLEIENCSNIRTLPPLPLDTLRALDVRDCPHLDSRSCRLRSLPDELSGAEEAPRSRKTQDKTRFMEAVIEWSQQGDEQEHQARQEIKDQMVLAAAIAWPPEMSELNCEGSPLSELPPGLDQLQGFTSLNLNFCRNLKKIPSAIGRCQDLQVLSADQCAALEELPAEIGELQDLRVLNLTSTGIQTLPEELVNCLRLEILNVGNCSALERLPNRLAHLHMLRELLCYNCSSLQRLPSPMEGLRRLDTLNLGGCTALEELPEDIGACRALRNIDLSDCRALQRLPASLGALRALQQLQVQGSGIESVPPTVVWLAPDIAEQLLRFQVEVPDGMAGPPGLPVAYQVDEEEAESDAMRLIREADGLSIEQRHALEWMHVLDWCANQLIPLITGETVSRVRVHGVDPVGINRQDLLDFFNALPLGVAEWLEGVFPTEEAPKSEPRAAFLWRLPTLPTRRYMIMSAARDMASANPKPVTWRRVFQDHCKPSYQRYLNQELPTTLQNWVSRGRALGMRDSEVEARQRVVDQLLAGQENPEWPRSLTQLTIEEPTLTELPADLGLWSGLQHLDLTGCSNLRALPYLNGATLMSVVCRNCRSLENFSNLQGRLPRLRLLRLENCERWDRDGLCDPAAAPSLVFLDVRGCSNTVRRQAASIQNEFERERPDPAFVVLGPPDRAGQLSGAEAVFQNRNPTFEVTRDEIMENPVAVLGRLYNQLAQGATGIYVKLDSGIDAGGLRRELWALLGEQIFTSDTQDEGRICAVASEGWMPLVRANRQKEDAEILQGLGYVMSWGQRKGLLMGPVVSPRVFSALRCAAHREENFIVLAALQGDRFSPLLVQEGELTQAQVDNLISLAEMALEEEIFESAPDPANLAGIREWLRDHAEGIIQGLYPPEDNKLKLAMVSSLYNGLVMGSEEAQDNFETKSSEELFALYQGRVSADSLVNACQLAPQSDQGPEGLRILGWLQNWIRDPLFGIEEPSDPVAREAEAERLRERFCQEVTGRKTLMEGEKLLLNVAELPEKGTFHAHTCFFTLDADKRWASEKEFREVLAAVLSLPLDFNKG